jgi:hypothetical protein
MAIGGAESERLSGGDRIQRLLSAIEVWRGAGQETARMRRRRIS